jgi:hypothetical protein
VEALDIQVKLLQDEISKIDRQEEEYQLRKQLTNPDCSLAFRSPNVELRVPAASSDLRGFFRDSEADRQAAEAGLEDLEKCLRSMKEENEEEGESPSLAEELASLEGMEIASENKIDLGKVASECYFNLTKKAHCICMYIKN